MQTLSGARQRAALTQHRRAATPLLSAAARTQMHADLRAGHGQALASSLGEKPSASRLPKCPFHLFFLKHLIFSIITTMFHSS